MRSKPLLLTASAALIAGMTAAALADDGERLVRQMSSSQGEVENPEPEGEHAYTQMLNFYVPAQEANGTLLSDSEAGGIEYFNADGALVKTEPNAKPLISFYLYGPVIGFEDLATSGFAGHGRRDAFAAVSLDDGATWKRTNLSESADKSSFVTSTPIPDPAVAGPEFVVTSETPTTTSALYNAKRKILTISGIGAVASSTVEIRNAVTYDAIGTVKAKANGTFTLTLKNVAATAVPCSVQAGYTTGTIWGPYLDVVGAPIACIGPDEVTLITDYPGDVTNGIHAMAGNKIIAAWQSKFCSSGFPAWSAEYPRDTVAGDIGIVNSVDLYLTDLFGVAGSQGSTNYIEQEEVAGEYDDVGEVPHSCLWTARGVLRENPEVLGTTEVVWFKAERLTSGRRDVNRVEASCVAGAGCAVSWQEDPEGVRPGEGEGPGTGWAGATTSSQTDVWYSFVRWEDFEVVDPETSGLPEPLPLANNILETGRPQPYVPMMVAARLTNNARCQTDAAEGYCSDAALAYGLKHQCIDTTDIPLGPQGTDQPVCVVDSNNDGEGNPGDMPNVANTASSRPRLSLQPRDSNGDGVTDDAWVMIFAEEDKGFGRFGFPNDALWDLDDLDNLALECGDPEVSDTDNCDKADTGKNIWWFSFAMGTPSTSVANYNLNPSTPATEVPFSLVNNLLSQGNILNQPEVNWRTGTFWPPMSTADMWDFSGNEDSVDYNYTVFNTEIARRSSMMAQSLRKAMASENGLVAMPLWKQGIANQGGPADIMARRFLVSTGDAPVECPIDENVDAEQPVVESATFLILAKTGARRLRVTVTGFDGVSTTGLRLRNAVTEVLYGYTRTVNETGPSVTYDINADTWNQIPCAIQVADVDGSLAFGPWTEVNVAALPPGESCVGEIPDACLTEGDTSMAAAADGTPIDETVANPYDFDNMACEYLDDSDNLVAGVKFFTEGTNPYYPKGLCMAPAINLSARTPYVCDVSSSGADGICPGELYTCTEEPGYGQLCVVGDLVKDNPEDNQQLDKMLSWYECPGSVGSIDGLQPACGATELSQKLGSNQNDQSWYNPLEIGKGHRGFLDGDFVQMLYAWSPNYKDNTSGKDRYELYVRRSFDGGATWTTTPKAFTASDGTPYAVGFGTTTCDTLRGGDTSSTDPHACTTYAAGAPEQSRNVSQLTSNAFTILDPRYAPTGTNLGVSMPNVPFDGADDWLLFEPVAPTDVRDASRYFVVFETGDNTTTAVGEAEPLDLNYMRAEWFGDHYTVWAELDTGFGGGIDDCFPNNPHGDDKFTWATGTKFCNEFDGLEEKKEDTSGEASVTASAYGDFLYGVWEQATVDDEGEFVEGDALFRRVWYLDNYIPLDAWTSGTGQE